MTLDQIDAFLAVIEYGNFAGAASSLYLTQSALGHRISNLEKELNLDLFMRARGVRRVELTSEGDQFIPIAKEMKALWERALALSGSDLEKNVRISFIFSLQTLLMPNVVSSLSDAGFKPHILSSNTASALKMLRDGDVDFALVGGCATSDDEAFMSDLLGRERLIMVSGPNSIYGPEVSVKDLKPSREVYSKWSTSNENWHIKVFGDSFSPLLNIESVGQVVPILESSTEAWALVPATFADRFLSKGELKSSWIDERPPAREVYLLARRPIQTECYGILSKSLRDSLKDKKGFELA